MNAIIFDFDGTIADSFDLVADFMSKKAKRPLTADGRQQLRGLSMQDMALKVGIPAWRLPLLYWQGKASLTKHMHKMPVFVGIPEALGALQHEDYKLFIISSNSKRNIDRFLTQHGLGGYFVKVYGNAGWLDKARALKLALRQNGLQPGDTVYVGDETRDVSGAHGAGMPSIAVNWGFCSEAALLRHNPTVLVRSPAELQKVLIDLGKAA